MSKKCCCSTTVIPYCYRCKKPDGRRYRSINDFNWSLIPQGVANASSETIYELCVRTRAIVYPGGPGTYPPLPQCIDEPRTCDTSPCADYVQAYSINAWTTQGAGSWREPAWPNCDNSVPDPLFDYEERCFWTASLFVLRTAGGGSFIDPCTSLIVGLQWMRKADQSVTIGGWATMVGPTTGDVFLQPSRSAVGHLDLPDEDGRIECDGFDETIPLTPTYSYLSLIDGYCPPDDATRCSLPTGLRLIGVL